MPLKNSYCYISLSNLKDCKIAYISLLWLLITELDKLLFSFRKKILCILAHFLLMHFIGNFHIYSSSFLTYSANHSGACGQFNRILSFDIHVMSPVWAQLWAMKALSKFNIPIISCNSKYNKCKENFEILQSIGIIAIKINETRAIIYTCRYSSGQLNP